MIIKKSKIKQWEENREQQAYSEPVSGDTENLNKSNEYENNDNNETDNDDYTQIEPVLPPPV